MQLLQEANFLQELKIVEDISWDAGKPLEDQLGDASYQFQAACRALGYANSLQDPKQRAKHRSRIMGMLNKLRASLARLYKAVAAEIQVMATDTPVAKI